MQNCISVLTNSILSKIKMQTLFNLYKFCIIPALINRCVTGILTTEDQTHLDVTKGLIQPKDFAQCVTLPKEPYFLSPGILWKVQKYQKNINFPSTFSIKKAVFPISEKFETKTFPCWRKYHLTSTFWIKKRPYLSSPKSSKQELSHIMNFSFRSKFMFL